MDREYICKTALKKEYYFTDAMIREIGEPDKITVNPYYKCAPPMHLYLLKKIDAYIDVHEDKYRERIEQFKKRSNRMSQVYAQKKSVLLIWAENVKINIFTLPNHPDRLFKKAVDYYISFQINYRNNYAGDFHVGKKAILNFLRHNYTNYENLLGEIKGKTGTIEAYFIIKDRINEIIEKLPIYLDISKDL